MVYKVIVLLVISLLIIYIKFVLPIPFISYENYHGISFLNNIYLSNNFDLIDYIKNQIFGNGASDGHTNGIIYLYLVEIFNLDVFSVFYIQSLFSILTYIVLSYSLYYLSGKNKILPIIYFFILLTFPHQIKYGFSEDYYILGNLFVSISILSLVLSFEYKKIIYFLFFSLFFILAIYSRTLYLLYIPVFILICVKYLNIKEIKNIKMNYIYYLSIIFLIFILLAFIYDRYNILISQNQHFYTGKQYYFDDIFYTIKNYYNYLAYILNNSYYSSIYLGLFIFSILNIIYYKDKKNIVVLIILFLYISALLYKYSSSGTSSLSRHYLLLEPLFLLFITYSFYFVFSLFNNEKIKKILLGGLISVFLIQPFIYKDFILKNYSMQKEFFFISENIDKIGNNLNIIIPNYVDYVEYDFPIYFLINKGVNNFKKYNVSHTPKNHNKSFDDDFEKLKNQNNIFYLSTACYSSGDFRSDFLIKNGMREDCKYMIDNFELTPIVEYSMRPETYFIPKLNTPLKTITIGFYKVGNMKSK